MRITMFLLSIFFILGSTNAFSFFCPRDKVKLDRAQFQSFANDILSTGVFPDASQIDIKLGKPGSISNIPQSITDDPIVQKMRSLIKYGYPIGWNHDIEATREVMDMLLKTDEGLKLIDLLNGAKMLQCEIKSECAGYLKTALLKDHETGHPPTNTFDYVWYGTISMKRWQKMYPSVSWSIVSAYMNQTDYQVEIKEKKELKSGLVKIKIQTRYKDFSKKQKLLVGLKPSAELALYYGCFLWQGGSTCRFNIGNYQLKIRPKTKCKNSWKKLVHIRIL